MAGFEVDRVGHEHVRLLGPHELRLSLLHGENGGDRDVLGLAGGAWRPLAFMRKRSLLSQK